MITDKQISSALVRAFNVEEPNCIKKILRAISDVISEDASYGTINNAAKALRRRIYAMHALNVADEEAEQEDRLAAEADEEEYSRMLYNLARQGRY